MDVTKNFQRFMKDFVCGHCATQSGYEIVFAQAEWDDAWWPDFTQGNAVVIVKCHNCKQQSIFLFDILSESHHVFISEFELRDFLNQHPAILCADDDLQDCALTWMEYQGQYPSGRKTSASVPEEVREALSEASNCLSVGASNAAVLMSRCVVERLASHLDADSDHRNRLADVLKEIRRREVVSDGIFQALFEIKDWGNIVAHRAPIDLNEARKVVDFVFQVVNEVFPQSSSMLDDGLKELRKLRQKKAR